MGTGEGAESSIPYLNNYVHCVCNVHSKIKQQELEKKRIRYSYFKYERIPLVVTIVKSRLIPALFDKFI